MAELCDGERLNNEDICDPMDKSVYIPSAWILIEKLVTCTQAREGKYAVQLDTEEHGIAAGAANRDFSVKPASAHRCVRGSILLGDTCR